MTFKEMLTVLYEEEEGAFQSGDVVVAISGSGHLVMQIGNVTLEVGHTESPEINTPSKAIRFIGKTIRGLSKSRREQWRRSKWITV